MKRAFVEVEKEKVLESYVSELALSQQEKFEALAEGIDFDAVVHIFCFVLLLLTDKESLDCFEELSSPTPSASFR